MCVALAMLIARWKMHDEEVAKMVEVEISDNVDIRVGKVGD